MLTQESELLGYESQDGMERWETCYFDDVGDVGLPGLKEFESLNLPQTMAMQASIHLHIRASVNSMAKSLGWTN